MQGEFPIKTTVCLIFASIVLLLVGVGIPIHCKALSPLLLERAGRGSRSTENVVSDYVFAGKTGPVRFFWESGLARPSEPERLAIVDLLSRKPLYVFSGGPAPYYEAFLAGLPVAPDPDKGTTVFAVLVRESNREAALGLLSSGSNLASAELLNARSLGKWKRFIPVGEPGGQPLDTSIVILAMLAESDSLRPEFAREIPGVVEGAISGDELSRAKLEGVLLANLALSRRMDWTQMTEFMRRVKSIDDLSDAASRILTSGRDDFYAIYSAAILVDDYGPVGSYLAGRDREAGMVALRKALGCGQGALEVLFEKGESIYIPPRVAKEVAKYLSWMRPGALTTMALRHPRASLALKNLLIFLSGIALTATISALWLTFLPIPEAMRKKNFHLLGLGNIFVAMAITIAIWFVIEPNLLRLSSENPVRAVFELRAGIVNNPSSSQGMNPNSLDLVSVLSLLFFLFLQAAVYAFCVFRVKRIKAIEAPAKVRLTLLENEDNLFDLGLYVGLFGTVAALLFIAMGVIQAGLVAAYSSTLFGVLFTAILKVVNVRVLRRDLILESSQNGSSQT
jgi:hypothetical protein